MAVCHSDALIFIDTNILLDFYRVRSGGVGLALLNHIDDNHDKIITGDQIAMEYKKNRQRVIVECLKSLKKPNWEVLDPPAFLSNAQPARIISREKKEIEKQGKKLKQTIEKVLKNPCRNDNVYKILQRLFKDKYPYNLTREDKIRFSIRRLARKRFILGYPPRKDNDTSIGDAINWEWIIYCSKESGKDVVIVSRDKDYGITYNNHDIINDWLVQEFKERTSRKRNIELTQKLSDAFKKASIPISKKEEKEEEDFIHSSLQSQFSESEKV